MTSLPENECDRMRVIAERFRDSPTVDLLDTIDALRSAAAVEKAAAKVLADMAVDIGREVDEAWKSSEKWNRQAVRMKEQRDEARAEAVRLRNAYVERGRELLLPWETT